MLVKKVPGGLLWGTNSMDICITLQWRHNGCDSVSNHQPHDCFLNRLFRHRSKKTPKLRVTGLCAGNSPEAGEFPAQMSSNAENVSIWWRHHAVHSRHACFFRRIDCGVGSILPTVLDCLLLTELLRRHYRLWLWPSSFYIAIYCLADQYVRQDNKFRWLI